MHGHGRAPNTSLGGQTRHCLEGLDELRTAVRITGIVQGVDANKDIARSQHLGPGQGDREKHGVSGRHVG